MKSNPLGINLFLIAVAVALNSPAQTAQSHPELCGRPGASTPIPDGVRWVPPPNDDTYASTLFLRNREGESRIELEVWPSMDQICPLPGDQLVLFGELNENYGIYRIDRKTASIIDGFGGRDPMMSPDQHWLIMRPYRHFRSERSDSEEYLLYDLTADAEKNRMKGLTPFTQGLKGRPVYPVPHDGVPFEFEDHPPELTHTFRSNTFYWAPDSSAVAFADSVMDKLSIVVVQVEPKGPSTLVLPVDVSGICEPQVGENADYPIPTLTGVDFGSSRTLIIHFTASEFCKSAQMSVRMYDFRPPTPEVHTPPKRRTTGTVDGVPFGEQK
jgi:hypothetical protein